MDFSIVAAALSAGLIVAATAFGIGKIGSRAVESIARQPEAADKIRGVTLLAAGFIEGVALVCAIICLLVIFK